MPNDPIQTTRHTAGPWAIFDTSSINMIVPAMREGMIADLVTSDADAFLIAAAPDLLEALKTLVMQRDAHFHTTQAWDAARAAIGKAEAESDAKQS